MQNIIIGIILLAVGFFGGYFVSNQDLPEGSPMAMKENGHAMSHDTLVEIPAGAPVPTVDLELMQDPSGTWNAHITTTNFRFAPEHSSAEHVLGEGHAHIYVDGVKINRVYGDWYHLGALEAGEHVVTVTLTTNDHNTYAVNGMKIEDSVTVVVEPKAAFDAANAQLFDLALTAQVLSPNTVTVSEGESVHLKVATDEAGEFHIAGYEIEKDIEPNGTTDIMFVADKVGRYNLEFHPSASMHTEEGEESHDDIEIGALVVNPK